MGRETRTWTWVGMAAAGCLALVLGVRATARGEAAPEAERRRAAEAMRSACEDLARTRQALAEMLQARLDADAAAGPAQDFVLRLEQAADFEEVRLTARQRGGEWLAAHATVPAWRHETMQEKYHQLMGEGSVKSDKFAYPLNTDGLRLAGDTLTGPVETTLRIDLLKDEREPLNRHFSYWDHLMVIGYTKPWRQRYHLQARVRRDTCEISCVLLEGVKEGDARRPLLTTFRVPAPPWDSPKASAPTWNRATHRVDASGLEFQGGRVRGDLRVTLIPDAWVPKDKKTRQVTYRIDGCLEHGLFQGRYAASGDLGQYEGHVTGTGGLLVEGRYRADGDFGPYEGRIAGCLIPQAESVANVLPETPPLPPGAEAAAAAAHATAIYSQVRALALALRRYPYPLAAALRQTAETLGPAWGAGGAVAPGADQSASMADYVEALRAAADGAREAIQADYADGLVRPVDPHFGPYARTLPLELPPDGPDSLPDDTGANGPQRWQFLTRWRILGPMPLVDEREMNWSPLPDLAPADGAVYAPDVERLEKRGVRVPDAESLAWQSVRADSGLVRPTWKLGQGFRLYRPSVWYAAAELHSDRARTVYVAAAANDHAKLWVNDRLVWVDAEKLWAYRLRDEAVFKVDLKKGPNRLLVRCRDDRQETWFRLHVCTAGEPRTPEQVEAQAARDRAARAKAAPEVAGRFGDGTSRFPDARPPRAWDIDKGINVAWRTDVPAGRTQPTVIAGCVFVAAEPESLYALDEKTGRILWSEACSLMDLVPDDARKAYEDAEGKDKGRALAGLVGGRPGRASTPVSDGRNVWVHYGTGVAACYDLAGKRRWVRRTYLMDAVVHLAGDVLVFEGETATGWFADPDKSLADPVREAALKKERKGPAAHGVLALDAASGERRWARDVPAGFQRDRSRLLRLAAEAGTLDALVTGSTQVLDAADGRVLFARLDVDPAGNYEVSQSSDTLFYTSIADRLAVRFWLDHAGRLAYRPLWASHYDMSGFFNVIATAVADDAHLYTWAHVLERGPHCPCAEVEVNVLDLATGRPVARVKPAMKNAVTHWIPPAMAGGCLFVSDAGGGSHGGHQTHGQVNVVRPGPNAHVLCPNLVDMGTAVPPVFHGERMFLRSPRGVVCVAVDGDEGRRYEMARIARTLIEHVGREPRVGQTPTLAPPADYDPPPTVPVVPFASGDGIAKWLAAGPIDGAVPQETLQGLAASLRAEPGATVRLGEASLRFAPLDEQFVHRIGPRYIEHFNTQGRGMRYPVVVKKINPRGFVRERSDAAALFYTVVDNPRERVVMWTPEEPGLDVYLAGRIVKAGETVRLRPGLYPMLVCVQPRFFRDEAATGPLSVPKAMAAGAVSDVAWPTTWRLFGPTPPDAGFLAGDELATLPETVSIGDIEYAAREMTVKDGALDLVALLASADGKRPSQIAEGRSAYCFAQIDCPADGTLVVNASADWFMAWHLDGRRLYSTLEGGNQAPPDRVTAHSFSADVTKGRHVLAVLVQSGSRGWSLASVGGMATKPVDQLAKTFTDPAGVKPRPRDFLLEAALKEVTASDKAYVFWLDQLRIRREALKEVAGEAAPSADLDRARKYLAILQERESR